MSTITEAQTSEQDQAASERSKTEAVAIFAIAFAAISILTAVFAVGIAVRAAQKADDIQAPAGGAAASGPVKVSLSEFKFTPNEISVPQGGSLEVTNTGTTAHDFKVEGIITNAIEAGDSQLVDLSALTPGTYDVECTIPGHKDSGMTATLTIT